MGQLKAGVAKANITPPIGFVDIRASFFKKAGNMKPRGVLDELYAKALVLGDGAIRAALVTLDLMDNEAEFSAGIRQMVERLTGIPPQNVLVSATRNNSAPGVRFVRWGGEADAAYLSEVQRKAAGAVYTASCHMREAKIGASVGEAPYDLAGPCSKYWWFEGQDAIRINRSARGLIDLDETEPPVDRQIGIVRIDDAEGRAIAALLNYGCTPICLGPNNVLVSAEYPGQATTMIEKELGSGAVALFFQGASGDVDPVHSLRRAEYLETEDSLESPMYADMRRMGAVIAYEALKVLETISTSSAGEVRCRSQVIEFPWWKMPTMVEMEDTVEAARQDLLAAGEEGFTWPGGSDYGAERNLVLARGYLGWAEDKLAMLRAGTVPDGQPCEIQVISLGPMLFIGVAAGLYAQVGLEVKAGLRRAYPDRSVLVCGLANGCFGYIPSRPSYTIEGGRNLWWCAKWYDMLAPVAPESGRILCEAIQQLTGQICG